MKNIPLRKIITSHGEPNATEGFAIRNVRTLLAGKDMVQELHRHDFFFVLALEKGKGKHIIDFTPYDVSDHAVFFMRPGQVHELALKAGSSGYLMEFKPDFYFPQQKISGQLLRNAGHKNLCQLDSGKFKKLLVFLTNIFQEYTDKQEDYQDVIKANLEIFFIELVRHRQNKRGSSHQVGTYAQEQLDKFMELLESHIATHKQVSDYADMMSLSAYQLNALTKSALGKTCSELINEQILLEAKRHLLATSNQVNQIAYQLGYDDVSYFIRFFKKHTGHTPEQFRNNFI